MNKTILCFLFFTPLLTFSQTEPSSNPTNLRFRHITHWGFDVAFTRSSADSFLVLKSESLATTAPVDGVKYQKGQWLGNAKIVSIAKADSFHVREVLENTEYFITIYAYNATAGSANYKQTSPLTGSITTPVSSPGNYYGSIGPSSPSFVNDLHNLIYTHTPVSYGAYKFLIQPNIWERDTVGGQNASFCAYSSEITVYTGAITFGGNPGEYSKEHCLPQSWMKTTSGTTADPDRADYYNLLVTNFDKANEKRSNYAYGKVVTPTYSYLKFKLGKDANNKTVAEPQDAFKGDAARNMMYEMLCYNNTVNSGNWGLNNLFGNANQQLESILKQWNTQDPPDNAERTKGEYIASIQFNRNPFIDHPEWADCINFATIVGKTCISGIFDEERLGLDFKWISTTSLEIVTPSDEDASVFVSDFTGRVLFSGKSEQMMSKIDMSGFPSGIYILTLQYGGKTASVKVPFIN